MSSNCVNGYPPFGTPQQVCPRSRIVLAAASGQSDSAIARELELNRHTVILWRRRFQQEGLDGSWEIAPGGGTEAHRWSRKGRIHQRRDAADEARMDDPTGVAG